MGGGRGCNSPYPSPGYVSGETNTAGQARERAWKSEEIRKKTKMSGRFVVLLKKLTLFQRTPTIWTVKEVLRTRKSQ